MIWSLAREQVRSQRRYTMATAVLVAITVALAAYGAFMAVTITHSSAALDGFFGTNRESSVFVSFDDTATFEQIPPNVDAANADDGDVVATAQVEPVLQAEGVGYAHRLVAMYGDVDWPTVLVEGAPPGAGEIAVSSDWARARGVGIGDAVELYELSADWSTEEPTGDQLTVSGLARSAFAEAAVEIHAPTGYVSWGDVPRLNHSVGQEGDSYNVNLAGNGEWQWSDPLFGLGSGADIYTSTTVGSAIAIAILTAIGVAALVVGTIATAFALGRAQGQARSRWVGTARALGATRRNIVVATLLECTVVGLGAGIAGVALGAVVAAAHVWLIASRVASPMLLGTPEGYGAVAAAGVLLALVLALIVGAVPAFWASRVEPAAALKPAEDAANIEISRRVWAWPVAAVWAISLIFVTVKAAFSTDPNLDVGFAFAAMVLIVTSVVMTNETLRRSLPWHAERLSRSKRRALLVAGDAIVARPRQATVPAFIVALATTVVVALCAQLVASWAIIDPTGGMSDVPNPYISPLIFLGVSIVVTVLCVVVGAATATVTAREAATRQALGVTPMESRGAAAVQYLVSQLHGLGLGLVGGAIGGTIALKIGIAAPFAHIDTWAGPVANMVLVVVGIASACALVGAGVVASFAPRTAPLSRVEVSA